jgi:hypothetical protein
MNEEIFRIIEMLDSNSSLKTYNGQKEVKNKLIKKYQVYDRFVDIEKEVVTAVIKKC